MIFINLDKFVLHRYMKVRGKVRTLPLTSMVHTKFCYVQARSLYPKDNECELKVKKEVNYYITKTLYIPFLSCIQISSLLGTSWIISSS